MSLAEGELAASVEADVFQLCAHADYDLFPFHRAHANYDLFLFHPAFVEFCPAFPCLAPGRKTLTPVVTTPPTRFRFQAALPKTLPPWPHLHHPAPQLVLGVELYSRRATEAYAQLDHKVRCPMLSPLLLTLGVCCALANIFGVNQ